MKIHCLPPFRKKQNPFYVSVTVWNTISAARAHFKKEGDVWSPDGLAYFVEYDDVSRHHFLGEVHFVLPHISLATMSHEFVHVAEAFTTRHSLREIQHCPYRIGASRGECIAYVTGTLMHCFYERLEEPTRQRLLANSLKPLK